MVEVARSRATLRDLVMLCMTGDGSLDGARDPTGREASFEYRGVDLPIRTGSGTAQGLHSIDEAIVVEREEIHLYQFEGRRAAGTANQGRRELIRSRTSPSFRISSP